MAALLALGLPRPTHAAEESITYFDLGIDVTLLPQNRAGAQTYFAKQLPETQAVLLGACNNYVRHPTDAGMPQTIKFCQFILSSNVPAVPNAAQSK